MLEIPDLVGVRSFRLPTALSTLVLVQERGPQQREFQHGSGRCCVVAQHCRLKHNTAVGAGALVDNTSSFDNTAIGFQALTQTTGGANTAVGRGALDQNITGNFNTAIGKDAGGLATGSGNVYIGHLIAGVAGENNHTYIRNIKDTSVNGGGADIVTIDLTTGLLGHASSSRRYKEDIRTMDKTSEALLSASSGHVSLQKGDRSDPVDCLWVDCRGGSEGESKPDSLQFSRSA